MYYLYENDSKVVKQSLNGENLLGEIRKLQFLSDTEDNKNNYKIVWIGHTT